MGLQMSKGSEEALPHLQGLSSIVTLKGGLDNLQLIGLPIIVQTLDLLYAVMFESQPILTDSTIARSSNISADQFTSDAEAFQRLIPILKAEHEDFQRSNQIVYADQLEGIPTVLSNASACLEANALDNNGSIEQFRASLVAFAHHSCVEDPLNPDALHLGRCCYFAFSTLFNVIVNKAPHRHTRNQELVEQLFDAIRRVKNRTWESIPYLRLFILLSAAVTTSTQSMKSFFKAELVRSIFQMGNDEWKRIEAFILRFLDMKRVLERPERRSSARIEMDTSSRLQAGHVARQAWQIPRYTNSMSLGSDIVITSTSYEHDNLHGAIREGVTCPRTLSKTPCISTTAAGSLHATPYEENIDPFLRLASIDEY